jgi:hypothetical protein
VQDQVYVIAGVRGVLPKVADMEHQSDRAILDPGAALHSFDGEGQVWAPVEARSIQRTLPPLSVGPRRRWQLFKKWLLVETDSIVLFEMSLDLNVGKEPAGRP